MCNGDKRMVEESGRGGARGLAGNNVGFYPMYL